MGGWGGSLGGARGTWGPWGGLWGVLGGFGGRLCGWRSSSIINSLLLNFFKNFRGYSAYAYTRVEQDFENIFIQKVAFLFLLILLNRGGG